MSEGFLDDRRKALEESFFHKRNAQLMTELREQLETEAKRKEFASVSGITDHDILDRFIQLNMTADTVAALSLVPLVRVAWADDDLDKKELAAIMDSATKSGIEKGSASYRCLESWLDQKPDDSLNEAWTLYVKELISSLSDEDKLLMKNGLMAQALRVAQAAGGVLGVGNKVSDVEQQVLDELAAAFE
jgi:hypothetical protein